MRAELVYKTQESEEYLIGNIWLPEWNISTINYTIWEFCERNDMPLTGKIIIKVKSPVEQSDDGNVLALFENLKNQSEIEILVK